MSQNRISANISLKCSTSLCRRRKGDILCLRVGLNETVSFVERNRAGSFIGESLGLIDDPQAFLYSFSGGSM